MCASVCTFVRQTWIPKDVYGGVEPLVSIGKTLVTKRKTLVTKGKTLVTKWKTLVLSSKIFSPKICLGWYREIARSQPSSFIFRATYTDWGGRIQPQCFERNHRYWIISWTWSTYQRMSKWWRAFWLHNSKLYRFYHEAVWMPANICQSFKGGDYHYCLFYVI